MFDIKYLDRIQNFENYLFDGMDPSDWAKSQSLKIVAKNPEKSEENKEHDQTAH